MKSSVTSHRRKILLASVPGLLSAALFLPSFSPAHGTHAPYTNDVTIHPGARGCVASEIDGPDMNEVRLALAPGLGLDPSEHATTDALRALLNERYGSRVSESATPMGYVMRWDPITEQWVVVCLSASQFEIDFGAFGSIVIESTDTKFPR